MTPPTRLSLARCLLLPCPQTQIWTTTSELYIWFDDHLNLTGSSRSFEDGPDSIAFNTLILKPEKVQKPDDVGSSSSETVQGLRRDVVVMEHTPVYLSSLKTRRIFVKDTAFKT